MVKVSWKQYKNWSGCRIFGTNKFQLTDEQQKNHMLRATWLTSAVEGDALFGSINSYDGAGISAGLEHKVAVLPNTMEQGSLWQLLRKIEVASPCQSLDDVWDALKQEKMFVAQDGLLRELNDGRLITAQEIRNLVAPPDGKVPHSGPNWEKAKKWAILFYKLFSDEFTYETQINSTIEYLVNNNKENEEKAYYETCGVYHPTVIRYDQISPELDLAWCVYHSFTPNAPSVARKCLMASNPSNDEIWPKALIRILGTTSYGHWHDTPDGKNRYDNTRIHAMKSKLWPKYLFEGPSAIMPKNL